MPLGCEITSVGMLNALGSERKQIEETLFSGRADTLTHQKLLPNGGGALCGAVTEELPALPAGLETRQSRVASMLYAVLQQMEGEIEALRRKYRSDRIGIVLGSSTSGIGAAEDAFMERKSDGTFPPHYHYFQQELGAPSEMVRLLTGFRGPAYTISTACSSSAKVFGVAKRLLDLNICDAVITGGADSLCRLTAQGFHSLELLSPERSNPFSVNRKGLNLGEGCCLAILERSIEGIQLLGVGEGSDAYHISTPHPEARGAILAINDALTRSGVRSDRIKYVNLHGTGTQFNDSMESLAIPSTIGERTLCSSTKPFTGHLLGAAGATEIGFCYYFLTQPNARKRCIPHVWDGASDGTLRPIRLAAPDEEIEMRPGDAVLSTSFAFGGSNCAVVLSVGA